MSVLKDACPVPVSSKKIIFILWQIITTTIILWLYSYGPFTFYPEITVPRAIRQRTTIHFLPVFAHCCQVHIYPVMELKRVDVTPHLWDKEQLRSQFTLSGLPLTSVSPVQPAHTYGILPFYPLFFLIFCYRDFSIQNLINFLISIIFTGSCLVYF